jgi:hypothetical protein
VFATEGHPLPTTAAAPAIAACLRKSLRMESMPISALRMLVK